MIPKLVCPECSAEVTPAESACRGCGATIDWNALKIPVTQAGEERTGAYMICPLCGYNNLPGAATCESCGNTLGKGNVKKKAKETSGDPSQKQSAKQQVSPFSRQWKVIAGITAVVIVILVLVYATKTTESRPAENAIPQNTNLMQEIESLQQAVENNPNDAHSLLMLANRLQDTRSFTRAIVMYQRYLQLKPSDPDAQVDLGISFFELSIIDSSKNAEYTASARREMQQALQIDPRHQRAHFNLGVVSLHAGDVTSANEWFKKCVQIDSTTEIGRKAKQLLNQHQFNNP